MSDVVIGPTAAPGLHVMTYNIRRRIGAAAWRPADRWSVRRGRLTALLHRERPSLLGVQEALPDQAAVISDVLGVDYRFVGRGRHPGGRGEGCPLFYDAARLELRDWQQLALSDEPTVDGSRSWGNVIPRVLVHATFRDCASGAEFIAVNTHLDPFPPHSRTRSAHELRRRVSDQSRPAIVLGDLNARIGSAAVRELLRNGTLRDAWSSARTRLTPEWGTHPGYRPPRSGAPRIDMIAATSDVHVEAIAINARTAAGGWPSDHLPVQAVVHIHGKGMHP